ncbi:MAG TPA: hypothetical protein VGO62_20760 [Myxococcota bacterium]
MSARAIPALILACGSCAPAAHQRPPQIHEVNLFAGLPQHEAQREKLCARGRVNAVTAVFCDSEAPKLDSIAGLQALLDLRLDVDDKPGFTLVGHSTAIATRSISAINPGSVIVSLPAHPDDLNGAPGKIRTDGNIVTLAYARGDQIVELAVTPPGGEIAFYLLHYERPCGDACGFEDTLTPRTESGFTNWSLYDDEDLKNTVLDCLQCHQPGGPSSPRIYRMQESENPWTHWLADFTLGGRALLDDTVAAHGLDDAIAGIPGALVPQSNPVVAEDLIRFSNSEQPNVFDAPTIEAEVQASDPAQPRDNHQPGASATWDVVYAASVAGQAIPVPYHDVKVTDPDKLAAATRALQAWKHGSSATLPDLRDVFADDALAGMSHHVKPGLDGRGVLVHACAQCHNGRLDQSLTRARFDVSQLASLGDDEKDLAITRMELPDDDVLHMPPHLFRDLTDDERALAEASLR